VAGVKVVLAPALDIRAAIEIVGGAGAAQEQGVDLTEILSEVDEGDVQVEKSKSEQVDLEKEAGESPVIRYVNYIIQTAVKEGASRYPHRARREEAEGALPHRRRALRDDEPAREMAARSPAA
jgi:hypothetical protein